SPPVRRRCAHGECVPSASRGMSGSPGERALLSWLYRFRNHPVEIAFDLGLEISPDLVKLAELGERPAAMGAEAVHARHPPGCSNAAPPEPAGRPALADAALDRADLCFGAAFPGLTPAAMSMPPSGLRNERPVASGVSSVDLRGTLGLPRRLQRRSRGYAQPTRRLQPCTPASVVAHFDPALNMYTGGNP